MIAVSRQNFARLVRGAIRSLPSPFQANLANVDVVVERRPSAGQMRRAKVPAGHTLLGLYEGLPQTRRGAWYNFALPDRITIFQEPIEATCETEEELTAAVRRTVVHEIAHHFGIDDARLTELGMG